MTFSSFTDFERLLLDVAMNHQISSNPNETEVLFCVDQDGKYLIDCTVGEKTHTQLTEKMKGALKSKVSCKLLHNHPKQGSISKDDWRICIENDSIVEIIAINTNGSVFRGAVKDRSRLEEIIQNFDNILYNVEISVCNNCTNFDLRVSLLWTVGDIVNNRLSELEIIKYCVNYGKSDLDLINDMEASKMIGVGKKNAESFIKKTSGII
jgi:hypothetical protein